MCHNAHCRLVSIIGLGSCYLLDDCLYLDLIVVVVVVVEYNYKYTWATAVERMLFQRVFRQHGLGLKNACHLMFIRLSACCRSCS